MNIVQALNQTKTNILNFVITNLNNKVDKEDGKVLSSNDFTTAEKEKLAELSGGFSGILPEECYGDELPTDNSAETTGRVFFKKVT